MLVTAFVARELLCSGSPGHGIVKALNRLQRGTFYIVCVCLKAAIMSKRGGLVSGKFAVTIVDSDKRIM
jgi:hypothetical protein